MKPIPIQLNGTHNTSKYAFRAGWRFPSDVDRWFQNRLSELDRPAPHPIASIPTGSSRFGEIRLDAYHPGANMKGDFFRLPFKDGSIGTIVADPPWEMNMHERMDYMRELARVHRHGGLLLWTAPFLPLPGVWSYDIVWVGSSRVGLPRNARLMVEAIRRPTNRLPTRHQKKAAEKRRILAGVSPLDDPIGSLPVAWEGDSGEARGGYIR